MEFNITTPDTANKFLLDFLQISGEEFIDEYVLNCNNDFEVFWARNLSSIEKVNINNLIIIAFHVTGSLDNCEEIKRTGLKNLQKVLTEDTELSRLLLSHGVKFDIKNRRLCNNGNIINIDYYKYRGRLNVPQKIKNVAHRVYYDYCVNGFLSNDDVFSYGTNIHERPEILLDLVNLLPELEYMEKEWIENSKSYRIFFFSKIDQIHRFCFDLDEYNDPPYENWADLSDTQKIKKWMLSHAIDKSNSELSSSFLYIKDHLDIPPGQIISCEEI